MDFHIWFHGEQQRDLLRKTNVNYIYHMAYEPSEIYTIMFHHQEWEKRAKRISGTIFVIIFLVGLGLNVAGYSNLIWSHFDKILEAKKTKRNYIRHFFSLVLNTASWWKCNLSLTIKRLKGLTQIQTYHIPNIFCLFYNVYRANKCFIVELCF